MAFVRKRGRVGQWLDVRVLAEAPERVSLTDQITGEEKSENGGSGGTRGASGEDGW